MINGTMVYCCCCNTLVAREKAYQIYATGFYKVVIPLGECAKCVQEKEDGEWGHLAAAEASDRYEGMCATL